MPRIVRTARGELVDFDTIIIKQQLAQAPMDIEVARRKEFIDSKESKPRVRQDVVRSMVEQAPVDFVPVKPSDFEIDDAPATTKKSKQVIEPIPIIPER